MEDADQAGPDREQEGTGVPGAGEAQDRLRGPLESLFQEAVRRALSLGLGGLFLTEEAVRRALSESVPREWVDYVTRQGEEVRSELADRMVREFGAWLRTIDPAELIRGVLEDYELSVKIELADRVQGREGSLEALPRRK